MPADLIAQTLANFAAGLQPASIPAEVSLRARHLILDAVGCALAARRQPFAERFAAGVHALDDLAGESRSGSGVIGFARALPPRDAALLNGVLTHGLDYDDTHMAGVVHLSVSVLPATLALAGRRGASGARMLSAYIAGIEAGARIASATRSGLHARGFHPTGVVGAFASALAAGHVMGLGAESLLHAQGIALSMASGSLQFIEDGAWTKRLHPGWAAQAGISAATFAAHGVVAPLSPFLGRYGFYRCYLGDVEQAGLDVSLATAGLAEDGSIGVWETLDVAVKPFPVCHFVHASADAAIALGRSGVPLSRIREIVVGVPAGVVQAVCEPEAGKRRPTSDYDARFSLPYAVASGLLRGRLGLKELEPQGFEDPLAQALMDRVRYRVDTASTFPRHYTGEVRLVLDDGSVLEHRESVNRGHAERPLSNSDVRDKFFDNATLHFPAAYAEAVCERVLALDRLESARSLETLLAREPA